MTNSIVIAGGGTAGWMAAAYLKRAFPHLDSITVIESNVIKAIGVGEATFSTLKLFFDFLGLDEREWMPACNATYKLGIKFVDWTARGGHFFHPFQRYEVAKGFNAAEWWLKLGRSRPFDEACFTVPAMCATDRSPRWLDGAIFDERLSAHFDLNAAPPNTVIAHHSVQYPYGYHFDAALVADYLRNYALKLGVKRIVDDIVSVEKSEDGSIAALHSAHNGALVGDLYIDCTGFRSLLLAKTLEEPFISFSDSLPNDRAVSIHVPHDVERNGVHPYTTATALSAGWAWTIPLFNRNGSGYVYCSRFLSPEDAEAEFRQFLGPAAAGSPANHIQMRIGRSRNSWVKNCVAIGLASAFVEPLESTGIFFIQHGIEELVNHFPRGPQMGEGNLLSYNSVIANCIDGVREFLTVHYTATDRADTPYWQATKHMVLPPSLDERMRIYRDRLPGVRNVYQHFHGFEAYSWSVMLLGLNYIPEEHLAALDKLDSREAEGMFDEIRRRTLRLTQTLPSHYEYLKQQRMQWGETRMVAS